MRRRVQIQQELGNGSNNQSQEQNFAFIRKKAPGSQLISLLPLRSMITLSPGTAGEPSEGLQAPIYVSKTGN